MGHAGYIAGFRSVLNYAPELDTVVVMLYNHDGADPESDLADVHKSGTPAAECGGVRSREKKRRSSVTRRSSMQFNTDDLSTLAQLMASGEVKSVIDRRFPLEETVDNGRFSIIYLFT